jgi:hypothetical protein
MAWIRFVLMVMMVVMVGCGGEEQPDSSAAGGGGGDPSSAAVDAFDPNDRDRAAKWWSGLVEELVAAKASENQIRVDDVMGKINAAREPLAGQRIRFMFNVWSSNPGLPETTLSYQPIGSDGVWVGLNHRAGPGRIRVGRVVPGREGAYPLKLEPDKDVERAVLSQLGKDSTFEISATVERTDLTRLDTWAPGFKQFHDAPTLVLYVKDAKVEQVNP